MTIPSKVGLVILVIIIVLLVSFAISYITFGRKVAGEVKELFGKMKEIRPEVVTERDLEGLPEPVQRYLRYTQIIGKERIGTVRLKQEGSIRTKEDGGWMPFSAQQYYTTDYPAFIWYGSVKLFSLPLMRARDRFYEGKGNMLIKLLPFITIADATGDEMDQGTLVRYLNEMMWFPTAYLNDYIQWESIDSSSAKATISLEGLSASAVLYFNEKGQMTNFVAERYMTVDDGYSLQTWSTPITEYKEINGMMLPTKGEGVWNLSSGDFGYITVEIVDIEYNNPSKY